MNKEKQIIEIKECVDAVYGADCAYFNVDGFAIADEIYNAGYHKQEWISVEERLPDCIMDCLVHCVHSYCDYDGYSNITIKIFANGEFGINKAYKVTHWMPLPEAPKMKGGKDND